MIPLFDKSGQIITNSCPSDFKSTSSRFQPGIYFFELWGASGGGLQPGYGGYVSGTITFYKPINLHLFIGQKGIDGGTASWNGGGQGTTGGSSGGGSTDIRLLNGGWDDFSSLKSRIIVAGGGGGSQLVSQYLSQGGHSGGLIGSSGSNKKISSFTVTNANGGSQKTGGIAGDSSASTHWSGEKGKFGQGGAGSISNINGNGGGSGYFGGGGSATASSVVGSGAGGSSYISGYKGCIAILENYIEGSTSLFSTNSIHYTLLYFDNTTMISGNSPMPNPDSSGLITGWNGDGRIRITIISFSYNLHSCQKSLCRNYQFLFLITISTSI